MKPNTLFDYYKTQNKPLPTVSDRGKLYESSGLGSASLYTGSAEQNAHLLGYLVGSSQNAAKPPTEAVPEPQSAVTVSQPPAPAPASPAAPSAPGQPSKPAPGAPTAVAAPNTAAAYKAAVEPTTGKPAAPNYADTYSRLRAEQGVSTLEDELHNLEASKAGWLDQVSKFKGAEQKGATSGKVYNARLSEEQRNVQDQIDIIDRQIKIAQNTLTTKTNFINAVMDWTKSDYMTARDDYETELTKNIQMQNYVDTQADKVQASARANLSAINTLISNSGKAWKDVPASLKNQVAQLELQAGFPAGTFEMFANSKPRANVVASGTGEDSTGRYAWAIMQDPDGSAPSVSTIPIGGPSSGGGSKLTLSEARTMGLPASLVGKTEAEIGSDLTKNDPPQWFIEMDPDYKGLSPDALKSEWNNFKQRAMSSRSL